VTLTLQDALTRAQQYSHDFLTARFESLIAHEEAIQAKAALLPSAEWQNQFLYTQPNGSDTGVFVASNGPREYLNRAAVHGDIFSPGKRAEWRRAVAAEAVARAKADIAARGLAAVVVQGYYGLVVAQRKVANAQRAVADAEAFVDITQKQEAGGEVAHADVVKAQLQLEQRRIDLQNAQLDLDKARIALGVMLFPNFGQPYTVTDDLDRARALPPFSEIQTMASNNNPFIRAAEAAVTQQTFEIRAARAGLYPTLSFDYFYGIDANQYALHDREGRNNLGSAAQAQLTVPLWTWGAARSKVRQAELRLQQARTELTFTQRQLLANLNSFYAESQISAVQLEALRRTVDLAAESLRLTLLRYQAGEVTALEVVDAQTTLAQARNAYDDGVLRYRLAIANLQSLTGAF
jgi:outer membrane protein TolC